MVMSSMPVSSSSHRGSVGLWAIFTAPKKPLIQSRYTHISECFFASAIAATDKWPFFRPKRRKQAFIGRQNKRPSTFWCQMLLPDDVRASHAPSGLRSPLGCHEVNIAEKRFTLRHPHHRPSCYSCIRTVYCMLYCFSAAISYYCICSRFCWCILY